MSRTDLWGFLWYLSGVTLAIGVFSGPNRVVLSALTALLAGHFAANVLAYLVTPWAIEDQLSSTIHRVVLHMMPGALLILLFGLPRGDDAGDRERHPFRGPARMPPVPSRARATARLTVAPRRLLPASIEFRSLDRPWPRLRWSLRDRQGHRRSVS